MAIDTAGVSELCLVVSGCLEECAPYSGPVPSRECSGEVILSSAMGKIALLQVVHGGNRLCSSVTS